MDTSKADEYGSAIPPAPEAISRPRDGIGRLMLKRMGRVLRLDKTIYAELPGDPTALRQATWVVRVAALAAAIGTALVADWHPGALLGAVVAAVLHWLIWAGVTFAIATRLFHSVVKPRHLVVSMGYAEAPAIITLLAFIPVAGSWIVVLSRALSFATGRQALQQTAALDGRRTAATAITAFVLGLAITALVKAWLGDIGPWAALLRP